MGQGNTKLPKFKIVKKLKIETDTRVYVCVCNEFRSLLPLSSGDV